jgi:hypothetical protein
VVIGAAPKRYNTNIVSATGGRVPGAPWEAGVTEDIANQDHRLRRCPTLGHDVPFSYCRAPAAPLPCRRILDCWWETFDVEAFVRTHFSEDQIRTILAPRPDKVATIVELIERARQRRSDEDK